MKQPDTLIAKTLNSVTKIQCLKPITIPHPNSEGKNKQYITVACKRCIACRVNRKNEWSMRMLHESKYHSENTCCTLTYSDEHIPENLNKSTGEIIYTLDKRDAQLFLKRLRFQVQKIYHKKIRFYLCGEYGDNTMRPHYHAIIFGIGKKSLEGIDLFNLILNPSRYATPAERKADEDWQHVKKIIQDAWANGNVDFGSGQHKDGAVTQKTIEYTAKYISKFDDRELPEGIEKPFSLFSKGLGLKWVQDHWRELHMSSYENIRGLVRINGYTKSAPRYYLQKAFTEEELKALKEERTPDYVKILQRHEKHGSGSPKALEWARKQEEQALYDAHCAAEHMKAKQEFFGTNKRNKI